MVRRSPMKLVNLNRLLRLADLLRELPNEQFDMAMWSNKVGCGMVGCIGGWATKVHPHLVLVGENQLFNMQSDSNEGDLWWLLNKVTGNTCGRAFEDAFELSMEYSDSIVYGNFRKATSAARHIDKLARKLDRENDFEIYDC